MEALKFDIYGKYAYFKNPESNSGTEFSFEHLHKPSMLGILGCILGLKGKEGITKDNPYPQYYEVLKDIKVAIVPNRPTFNKFQETITNTTGFANDNSTQVLNREILQDARWTIYILKCGIEEVFWSKLGELLSEHESRYPLYLGNNSYKAQIDNVDIIELDKLQDTEEIVVSSIFNKNIIEEKYNFTKSDLIIPYDLKMYFPIDLNELLLYKYGWFEFTNLVLELNNDNNLYLDKDKVLYFM